MWRMWVLFSPQDFLSWLPLAVPSNIPVDQPVIAAPDSEIEEQVVKNTMQLSYQDDITTGDPSGHPIPYIIVYNWP